jgi:tryptophan synthase alpha chain
VTIHNRIDQLFAKCREERRAALILYLTAGFPDEQTTRELLPVLAEAGCDLVELGIPFSDPIADGPVIQRASSVALDAGMTYPKALELARQFRQHHETALIFFGALNPFLYHGLDKVASDLASIKADGLLAADLPLDESDEIRATLASHNLHLITLIAPTTPDRRLAPFAAACSGFVYCIAYKGTTGTKEGINESVATYLGRLRGVLKLPLALGFGIKQPVDVRRAVDAGADAVVVGTALIELIEKTKASGGDVKAVVRDYVASLTKELRRPD